MIRERDFFFRPQQAPVEVIWCCFDRSDYARKLLDPHQFQRAQSKVIKEMSSGFAFRLWPHPSGYELVFRSRFGLVRFKDMDKLVRFELQPSQFSSRRLWTPPEQLEEVAASCEAEVEKIRKAVQCMPGERGWASVKWPWGTPEELRTLIRAMGHIVRRPEHGSVRWLYPMKPKFAGCVLEVPYSSRTLRSSSYEPFLRCLRTHFPVDSDKLELYSLGGIPYMDFWPTVMMSSSHPTEHERLEALLVWRDFLRDKLPPEEIESLLKI